MIFERNTPGYDVVFVRPAVSLVALVLFASCLNPASAEPWVAPGDVTLRNDLQLLSDTGLIRSPGMSWPLPWSSIVRDLDSSQPNNLPPAVRRALGRVRSRAAQDMRLNDVEASVELAGAYEPYPLRTFEQTPREEGEAALVADWTGRRFAWKLSARAVADADDGQDFRADGSYIAANLGNWIFSAGYLDRWWGPGWEGSLILSTSARPVPTIAIDRNDAAASTWPVLRWLGPWRLSTFMGQLESDRDYPHALLFGMRAEIRPLPSLQLAASRTAQWCGEGRPCDLDTFVDLLIGNDNDQAPEDQPGNQLAGFDVRWSWPGGRVPIALYAQAIGEDEAGFMPAKYLGLFGTEVWGEIGDGSWRAHVEYADTACDFLNSPPIYGCAYTNVIYTSGYRYRGRAVGHTMDADGESIGAGAMLIDSRGHRWELLGRNIKLNRGGVAPGHSLAAGEAKVQDLAVTHERAYAWGNITLSFGYSDVESGEEVRLEDGLRGFLTWRHQLR